jgi:hypothetical protein
MSQTAGFDNLVDWRSSFKLLQRKQGFLFVFSELNHHVFLQNLLGFNFTIMGVK